MFEDEAAKMQDLEARIKALEDHACPQQGVLDDLLAHVAALEAKPASTVDLTPVNAALAKLDARLDKIALGAVG